MTNAPTTADGLVGEYLDRLRRSTRGLDPATQADVLLDVEQHIRDARAAGGDDPARVRQILADLGPPEQIAAASGRLRGPNEAVYDRVTIALLALGGAFPPVLGWLAGVVLLWRGPRWTLRDRLLGTLVWPLGPAGLVTVNVILTRSSGGVCVVPPDSTAQCGQGTSPWIALAVAVVYVGIGAAVCWHLARRAASRRAPLG